MKRLLILLIAIPLFTAAQEKIYVQGTSPDLYLTHVVAPREGFYKIARLYNVNAQKLADYNSINFDKGPNAGQTIKIPLTADNFSQDDNVGSDETLIPLYHIIQEKEGLYRLSAMFNKVPITKFEKWNNLKGEGVNKGASFIIGYLKVKTSLSALAKQNTETTTPQDQPVATPVIETPKPIVTAPVKPVPVTQQPLAAPAPVETPTPTPTPQPVTPPVVKPQPVIKQEPAVVNDNTTTGDENLSEGVFKADYERQTAKDNTTTETGNGSSFKSASGWVDGKYYCLQNNATHGTVVKITNPDNGKTIYAKVLDPIPDISQNGDVLIIVNNAAAEALGAGKDGKFTCTVEYTNN